MFRTAYLSLGFCIGLLSGVSLYLIKSSTISTLVYFFGVAVYLILIKTASEQDAIEQKLISQKQAKG